MEKLEASTCQFSFLSGMTEEEFVRENIFIVAATDIRTMIKMARELIAQEDNQNKIIKYPHINIELVASSIRKHTDLSEEELEFLIFQEVSLRRMPTVDSQTKTYESYWEDLARGIHRSLKI